MNLPATIHVSPLTTSRTITHGVPSTRKLTSYSRNVGDESALRQSIAEGGASFNPVTGEVTALYVALRVDEPQRGVQRL